MLQALRRGGREEGPGRRAWGMDRGRCRPEGEMGLAVGGSGCRLQSHIRTQEGRELLPGVPCEGKLGFSRGRASFRENETELEVDPQALLLPGHGPGTPHIPLLPGRISFKRVRETPGAVSEGAAAAFRQRLGCNLQRSMGQERAQRPRTFREAGEQP